MNNPPNNLKNEQERAHTMTEKVKIQLPTENCETCPAYAHLEQMGLTVDNFDRLVALAGNPNTGKSTVFNALTGLKQHTGNWPGKTVTRAEGGYQFNGIRYKLVDLPGTYSLLSASQDEEVARDFILFGQPDCTIVVTDATALERNLNLVMQVMEITDKVVVAINLMDEARRKGLTVDSRSISRDLGVPAVPITARTGEGMPTLLQTVEGVIKGDIVTQPLRVSGTSEFQQAIEELVPMIEQAVPGIPNARWLAIRLLDGDARVQKALHDGELPELMARQGRAEVSFSRKMAVEGRQ
jgi:GTP-binding protein